MKFKPEVTALWTVLSINYAVCSNINRPVCEPIKVDMCKQIGYNETAMPNFAGHSLQTDAQYELETFAPLIHTKCANELLFFLCFAYVPMCLTEATTPQKLIGPCRPLCERVRSSCLSALAEFQYNWPKSLDCSKFPDMNNHFHMCMEGPGESHVPLKLPPTSFHTLPTNVLFAKKVKEAKEHLSNGSNSENMEKYKNYLAYVKLLESNLDQQKPAQGINVQCARFKKSSQYRHVTRLDQCIPVCEADVIFTKEEKEETNQIIIGLSVVCLVLTTSTFLTLLTDGVTEDSKSFPDLARKSILYFTLACTGLCATFLFSRFFKATDLCLKSDDQEILIAAYEGHRNQPCTVVFLFVNFFGTAVSTWFSVAVVNWCLACLKITKPLISLSCLSSINHAYGWGLPAILTLVALVSHKVEFEEYSSLCLAGGAQKDFSFLMFTVIPQGLQVFVSVVFAFIGIVLSLSKMNDVTSTVGRQKESEMKLRSLTMNYVIFSVSYILVASCVWGINIYEYRNRLHWIDASQTAVPDIQLLHFRLIATFLSAISPFTMILSTDSANAWKKFCSEFCLKRFWSRDKPRTPVFPQVAYQPQSTVDNQVQIGTTFGQGHYL